MDIIIGILIGVIITTCVVGKAIYDVLKELKDEDKKKKTYNIWNLKVKFAQQLNNLKDCWNLE